MAKHDTPADPFALALNTQRELLEAGTEAVEKAGVAEDAIDAIQNVEVGETPSEVVYEENKLELLHYESQTDEQHDVPILIVYALINRPYILDLQPDRSVVRRLLEAGHDVYLIDWNEPSRLDQHLTLDDYVNRYMDNCVDVVRERSEQDSINILGYCMGGTMSVMYTALHQEKVRTLGLMAAGLCFDGTGGVLELWGDEEYYDPEAVTETFGNMPAEILDIGFALMDPVANYVSKYTRLYDNIDNGDFVKNFARMERWLDEGIDVAGEAYVQFLRDIYQDNKLYHNELYLGDKHVDVTSIEVPVLQVIGEYDHLIPADASKPFNEVIGSDDVTTIEYPTGHIGLSVSGSSHRDVWPQVAEWYFEHSSDDLVPLAEVEESVAAALGVDVETDVTAGDLEEVEVAVASEDADTKRLVERDAEAIEQAVREAVGAAPDEEAATEAPDPAGTEGSDLEELSGIGPTYAKRLREAGIMTLRDLAEADVETLADATEAPVSRAEDWLDAARKEHEDASTDPGRDIESDDIQMVDGIGPTYAERLRGAGIDTVAMLAAAEVAEVADAAEVSQSRAEEWLKQVQE